VAVAVVAVVEMMVQVVVEEVWLDSSQAFQYHQVLVLILSS
jgi:hypothetical protein